MLTISLERLDFEHFPDRHRIFLVAFSLSGPNLAMKAKTERRIFCCFCYSKIIAKGEVLEYVVLNPDIFLLKIRLAKFCTELLYDKIDIFRERESGSNQWRPHYDMIFALLRIKNS